MDKEPRVVIFESLPTRGAWIEMYRYNPNRVSGRSLPTRGAWIEMIFIIRFLLGLARSLPTRGAWIEIVWCYNVAMDRKSLPTRGAWIEIGLQARQPGKQPRRSPHGERGLKLFLLLSAQQIISRSPHGERGLKSIF